MVSFSQQQLDYFYAQPLWTMCTWAISIWSSALAFSRLLFVIAGSLFFYARTMISLSLTLGL